MTRGRRLKRSDVKHKFLSEFMPPLMLLKRKTPEEIARIKPPNTATRTAIKEDCNPTPRNLYPKGPLTNTKIVTNAPKTKTFVEKFAASIFNTFRDDRSML